MGLASVCSEMWAVGYVCQGSGASWGGGLIPHPPPAFISPFRLQVEVWAGVGVLFLICCCKRREREKPNHQEALSKLQGPGVRSPMKAGGWYRDWDTVRLDSR